jgi:WD40 repeat protein
VRRLETYEGPAAFIGGGRFALANNHEGRLCLLDLKTAAELHRFEGFTGVNALAVTADGRRFLAGCQDASLVLGNLEHDRPVQRFLGHHAAVRGVALSADGGFALSSAGQNQDDLTVRLWDTATGKELRQLTGHTGLVWGVALSADGSLAVTGGDDGTVRLWDTATGQERARLRAHTRAVRCVALSPDGRVVASGNQDGSVNLWDVPQSLLNVPRGQPLRTFGKGGGGDPASLAFTPDGRRLLAGYRSREGLVRLWDVAGGQPLADFPGHPTLVASVACSPDGRYALSGDVSRSVILWQLPRAATP